MRHKRNSVWFPSSSTRYRGNLYDKHVAGTGTCIMQECWVGIWYRMPFPHLTSLPPSQAAGLHSLMDRFRSWGNISNYTSRKNLKEVGYFIFFKNYTSHWRDRLSVSSRWVLRKVRAYSLPSSALSSLWVPLLKECLHSVPTLKETLALQSSLLCCLWVTEVLLVLFVSLQECS